jgi:hypothetical protein
MTNEDTRTMALQLIAESRHNAYGFIADRLNRLGVPTLSGRGRWDRKTVLRLANEAGITCGYIAGGVT